MALLLEASEDLQLENYDGVDLRLRPEMERFERSYRPDSLEKVTQPQAGAMVKEALSLNPEEYAKILSTLIAQIPITKIIEVGVEIIGGRRMHMYSSDSLRLLFAITWMRKQEVEKGIRLNFSTLSPTLREKFGSHRLSAKLHDPQGSAYRK